MSCEIWKNCCNKDLVLATRTKIVLLLYIHWVAFSNMNALESNIFFFFNGSALFLSLMAVGTCGFLESSKLYILLKRLVRKDLRNTVLRKWIIEELRVLKCTTKKKMMRAQNVIWYWTMLNASKSTKYCTLLH